MIDMTRFVSIRILRVLVVFALIYVLPACGLLDGNGDDEKFPEPPDRPSSVHVGSPDSGPTAGSVPRTSDAGSLTVQFLLSI